MKKFFTSYKATIIMMAVYALLLAVATFIEKYHGTKAANLLIYHSPAFFLLNICLIANFIGISYKKNLFKLRKYGFMLSHIALIIILFGAFITHLCGEEWVMHLRQGHETSLLVSKDKKTLSELPFTITLKEFKIQRYPGSNSPSSYESLLTIKHHQVSEDRFLYMNHVIDYQGYRFFQASYDKDEKGSIIAVNKDVLGRNITYFGYFILALGLLICVLGKRSRFRNLYKQLSILSIVTFLSVFSLNDSIAASHSLSAVHLENVENQVSLSEHLKDFGELPMLSGKGRIEPVNTFASEICRKLHINSTNLIDDISSKVYGNEIKKYLPEYFIYSIIVEPEKMAYAPLIHIKDKELRAICGGKEYINYRSAFDEAGHYKFVVEVENAYRKRTAKRNHLDNEWLKLDEKINILHQLFNLRLLNIFPVAVNVWNAPGDDFNKEYTSKADSIEIVNLFKNYRNALIQSQESNFLRRGNYSLAHSALQDIREYQNNKIALSEIDFKVKQEALYNRLNLISHCKRGYLLLGFLLIILSVSMLFSKTTNVFKSLMRVGFLLIFSLFILHTASLGMRWFISGHAPWSNSYETMEFLSWSVILVALIVYRKSFLAFSLSVQFAGVVLFVASLSWMNPEITPLVPVLKSPWLMFHVATIMIAYGLLGINAIGSAGALVMTGCLKNNDLTRKNISKLTIINEMSLILGLVFIMIGIFLGAIWANESWGNYWSWDPKETWALITAIVYAIVLHIRIYEKKKSDRRFNILSLLSFSTILMTYFGVNYLLSGMHSYGNTTGLSGASIWIIIALACFFIVPIVLGIKSKNHAE